MAKLGEVIDALRACDRTLRAAICDGASEARPEQLNKLVDWLKQVQRILDETALPRSNAIMPGHRPPRAVNGGATERPAGQYPRFFRDADNNLVKIGWSKKFRSEYEHKAPREVISRVALSIAEAGKNRKRFVMEKLMPFRDPSSGASVPDYQAYIALAWLRSLGLVIQHGRRGYTLANGTLGGEALDNVWDAIPMR